MDFFGCAAALQLLVVTTPDWGAVEGVLYRYERPSSRDAWQLVAAPHPVTVGKNGMAWGRGLHPPMNGATNKKREGDGRSPCGIYALGPVFCASSYSSYSKKMPFFLVEEDVEWVDDPNSLSYNRLITGDSQVPRDWNSSEKMKEIGHLYDIGLVVQHNSDPILPQAGSAIFFHIWSRPGGGTGGCTAMDEKDLCSLISWLDETKQPCLVQLPQDEYALKKSAWRLPELPALSPSH